MNREQLKAALKQEEAEIPTGWDFSHLDSRMVSGDLPWDYSEILKRFLKPTDHLLDMGTGGGEFLLILQHPYKLTTVTEDYLPNVRLCEERLTPLGIKVHQVYRDHSLPFEDNTFDIVLNRHTSFDEREVFRVLKNGGCFITQQVGGKNNRDLSKKMIEGFTPGFPDNDLQHFVNKMNKAGFTLLEASEAFPPVRFYDLGAFVFYAKIVEWEYPGFSVDACFEKLCPLQEEIEQIGFIESAEHRFLIAARK